ncbi:MAG TPA: hypothetical protein VL172_05850 [Kofleriaceae bacterium]|nr:hypothetical protein [Kofleriaceae bacterium]
MRAAAAALVACIPLAFPSTALADDAAARGRSCDRALREPDPARIHLHAELCLAGDVAGPGGPGARRARIEAARDKALATLRDGQYAPVDIEVTPPGATVTVAALGADGFAAPRTIWLPFGPHEIRATAPGYQGAQVTIRITNRDPAPPLRLTLSAAVDTAGGDNAVDFGEEGAAGDVESASDLPAAKHDELLKDKYRKGLAATGTVTRAAPAPPFGAGLRVGTGAMMTSGSTSTVAWLVRAGLQAHYALTPVVALQIEPAAQLTVGDDTVPSLSAPVLLRVSMLRAGAALDIYRVDGRTEAEVAGVLGVAAFRHFDAHVEIGLNTIGQDARTFALLVHWDSGG